ncbi:hypothetical protein M2262_003699 [Pseudomonas sp. BIGb0408]|uniref:Uncharacterized protein n=1 Tax=Phytopseudomonas flavescens TaxID=29435 RepID=A0A7Z0BLU4_9GAMM|nr:MULTISPECIES: hypothetical protein [Pseudomonas]MCW2293649.1 hypothetical protein [Pseudomonas sp. BIGb0408]NYH71782.1 hypothetical protein [Pseudomonas flavescens]
MAGLENFIAYETYPASVAIQATDQLFEWWWLQRIEIAFIDGKLIRTSIARAFFTIEARVRTQRSYQDVFGPHVLWRSTARAALIVWGHGRA